MVKFLYFGGVLLGNLFCNFYFKIHDYDVYVFESTEIKNPDWVKLIKGDQIWTLFVKGWVRVFCLAAYNAIISCCEG